MGPKLLPHGTIGQTGQIFRKKPTAPQFERTVQLAAEWAVEMDRSKLKEATLRPECLGPNSTFDAQAAHDFRKNYFWLDITRGRRAVWGSSLIQSQYPFRAWVTSTK